MTNPLKTQEADIKPAVLNWHVEKGTFSGKITIRRSRQSRDEFLERLHNEKMEE